MGRDKPVGHSLLFVVLLSAALLVGVLGCRKQATETPAEVPAEAPAEVPAEVPAEEPAEEPAEVPTEVPAEEPAEVLAERSEGEVDKPVVVITTSKGTIEVELDPERAPKSVANFLQYVDDEFYDGTIFHRVIDNFMIQGGGFTPDFQQKETRDPIKNEADNGLKNERYTIAMARTAVVDSATAQFYINVRDNPSLDHRSRDQRGFGYAVFGRVTGGRETVDAIKSVATGSGGHFPRDVPQEQVLIESIRRKQ